MKGKQKYFMAIYPAIILLIIVLCFPCKSYCEEKQIKTDKAGATVEMLGMTFAYIPPGNFVMGSPSDEPGRDNDETRHTVTISKGFYMQTTEVTQGQWKTIMGNNPSHFNNCSDDCPVESISWNDVQNFINKLNERHGSGTFRLPTEAEWEYAARAGSTSAFVYGGITDLKCGYDARLRLICWYCGNAKGMPHPVAEKNPNAWGLYDMNGNVWEWCQDWYGDYPSDAVIDPAGPASGSRKVMRSGSWNFGAAFCRSANRCHYSPDQRDNRVGFRLVAEP